jgi:hypothetical protein
VAGISSSGELEEVTLTPLLRPYFPGSRPPQQHRQLSIIKELLLLLLLARWGQRAHHPQPTHGYLQGSCCRNFMKAPPAEAQQMQRRAVAIC